MPKPGMRRHAPAILKRRPVTPTPLGLLARQLGPASSSARPLSTFRAPSPCTSGRRTSAVAAAAGSTTKPLVVEVQLANAPPHLFESACSTAVQPQPTPSSSSSSSASLSPSLRATAVAKTAAVLEQVCPLSPHGSDDLAFTPGGTAVTVSGPTSVGSGLLQNAGGTANISRTTPIAPHRLDAHDDADLWDMTVSVEPTVDIVPLGSSVATQVDFPSRALSALTRRLIERCGSVSPSLGSRAAREDLIGKLVAIVSDAGTSAKARFLLEQMLAYKSKVAQHSSFMTRHSKVLMEISPKAYRHLKCVDGTGLLTLPCRGTLRHRYPEMAPPQTGAPLQKHSLPKVTSGGGNGGGGGEHVVLQIHEDNSVSDSVAAAAGAAEIRVDPEMLSAMQETAEQTTPTYYYVVPGGDESVFLSNVIMARQTGDEDPT